MKRRWDGPGGAQPWKGSQQGVRHGRVVAAVGDLRKELGGLAVNVMGWWWQ